jgi:hypothetical protein
MAPVYQTTVFLPSPEGNANYNPKEKWYIQLTGTATIDSNMRPFPDPNAALQAIIISIDLAQKSWSLKWGGLQQSYEFGPFDGGVATLTIQVPDIQRGCFGLNSGTESSTAGYNVTISAIRKLPVQPHVSTP